MAEDVKVVTTNRKAGFEYFLLERFEAGLAFQGSEIKSIRAGQMSIVESYVDIEDGREAFLVEAHIAPYEQANRFNHDPKRKRRLLLHKKEIREAMESGAVERHDDCSDARIFKRWSRQDRNRFGARQEIA